MYVILWEFTSKPGLENEFERLYGSEGVWNQLFRHGKGYLGTELLKGTGDRYISIDRWTSLSDYESFKHQYAEEYKKIDEECASVRGSESQIGSFLSIST
jgi:heme-degrading monooxygenase HmoA